MKTKKKYVFILIVMMVVLFMQTKVEAALQSNGGGGAMYSLEDWILRIRQMQASGGTLGLNDSINTSNLTSNNTNLDIHMEKNTEYGAMAILSASSYGNPNSITDGGTTTGNATGVVIKINKEWVSAVSSQVTRANLKNAVSRYKNIYESNYVARKGDALNETKGWHDSGFSRDWGLDANQGLLRCYSGGIFSYMTRQRWWRM